MSVVGINTNGNKEQGELVRLIFENDRPVIFGLGNAGTGKTFITVAASLQLLQDKKYGKIIYTREPEEVGKSLGFLPGDVDEKFSVYMRGLYDNLEHIEKFGGISKVNALAKIECIPLQYLRGASFENTIVIVDEAQNLSMNSIKTILTRAGKFCKVVLLGSVKQIDNRFQAKKDKCDFLLAKELLEDQSFVGSVELIKSMRSTWCSIIDELLP
jgi:predicted ribonuclease YlaK